MPSPPVTRRDGLSATQRSGVLARLGRDARDGAKDAEVADAVLQQSDSGLELGRLLAERDALRALATPGTARGVGARRGGAECGAAQFTAELDALPDGAEVAVVSLLGSLNPVTLGHVQCFDEARRLLLGPALPETLQAGERAAAASEAGEEATRPQGATGRLGRAVARPARLEAFDGVVGVVELNSDQRVGNKVRARPGRLSALAFLSVFRYKSILYGVFVWARRALKSKKRRFSARADGRQGGRRADPAARAQVSKIGAV
jgi:hypothetical protein